MSYNNSHLPPQFVPMSTEVTNIFLIKVALKMSGHLERDCIYSYHFLIIIILNSYLLKTSDIPILLSAKSRNFTGWLEQGEHHACLPMDQY